MKKWFAALLVSFASGSHAASDVSINATVESVAGTNENGGFIVLRPMEGSCLYYGNVWETGREPHGLGERIVALASGGKIYDWMTTISYSACLQRDGSYAKERVSLVSPGGKRLRMGDSVMLRSSL